MNLKTENGNLRLSSAYKLIVIAWILSWGALMGIVMLIMLLITLITGEMTVNEQVVQGRGAALMAILPMFILFPIIIILQSFMFAAMLVGGLWLYRLKRPLRILDETGNSISNSTFT